ncbi:hypothetical protein [Streptomyces sp. NPDC058603]|uniref:hypothetical protein n=1 Tax=Streptomyces sp. NPDC058603 TaxID=3346551 RepID=UPI003648355E
MGEYDRPCGYLGLHARYADGGTGLVGGRHLHVGPARQRADVALHAYRGGLGQHRGQVPREILGARGEI